MSTSWPQHNFKQTTTSNLPRFGGKKTKCEENLHQIDSTENRKPDFTRNYSSKKYATYTPFGAESVLKKCNTSRKTSNPFAGRLDTLTYKHAKNSKEKKSKSINSKKWTTGGILTSIKKRDNIHKRYLKCKNPINKEALFQQYKQYRHVIVTLCKRNKSLYYQHPFQEHKSNLKKVWSGIKSKIHCKDVPSSMKINNKLVHNTEVCLGLYRSL